MDAAATLEQQRRAFIVLGAVFLALAPVAIYARLGTVVLLAATLIAQSCYDGTMTSLRGFARSPMVRVGALFTLWAAISLFWTPAPKILGLPSVAIVPVMGLLLLAAVRKLPQGDAARLGFLAMIGGVVMLAFFALEVWSQGALLRFFVPTPPGIAPDQTLPVIEAAARGGAVVGPLAFVYASLIYTRTTFARPVRLVLSAVFIALAIAVGMATSMDAAWVSIALGAVVFVAALIFPRLTLVLFFAGLMFYAALAPAISAHLLTVEQIPNFGARAWLGVETRIGIWQEAARLITQHPIIGHGFDATRELSKAAPLIPGTPYPSLPLHTHNGFLQIWLELGVVGIGFAIALLALAIRALWPLTVRPLELALTMATIASTFLIFLVSFGIWQHWWIALWFIVAALLQLALRNLAPQPV